MKASEGCEEIEGEKKVRWVWEELVDSEKDKSEVVKFLQRFDDAVFLESNLIRKSDTFAGTYYCLYEVDGLEPLEARKLVGVGSYVYLGTVLCCFDKSVPNELKHLFVLKFKEEKMKLLEAEDGNGEFKLRILIGERNNVSAIVKGLNLQGAETSFNSVATSFKLELDDFNLSQEDDENVTRLAEEKDLLQITELKCCLEREALNNQSVDFEKIKRWMKHLIQEKQAFVVESDKDHREIASMALITGKATSRFVIGGVYTRIEYRNQHLSTTCMRGMLKIIKEKNDCFGELKTAILEAENPIAIRMYKKLGFKEGEEFYFYILKEAKLLRDV